MARTDDDRVATRRPPRRVSKRRERHLVPLGQRAPFVDGCDWAKQFQHSSPVFGRMGCLDRPLAGDGWPCHTPRGWQSDEWAVVGSRGTQCIRDLKASPRRSFHSIANTRRGRSPLAS